MREAEKQPSVEHGCENLKRYTKKKKLACELQTTCVGESGPVKALGHQQMGPRTEGVISEAPGPTTAFSHTQDAGL